MIKNLKLKIKNSQKGVSLIVAFLIMVIIVAMVLNISIILFNEIKIISSIGNSVLSYHTAESGIEDALMLLKNNPQMPATSYSFNGATITITSNIGGSRTILSKGDKNGIIKNIEVVYAINSQGISFFYGAQVGAGGLQMSNSSKIIGNVFSNGNITGSGIATIDNDAVVAGNGNALSGMSVKGNALAYSCSNSTINGNLTYVLGGTNNCTVVGSTSFQSGQIPLQPLPITQGQIDGWKSEATAGGITSDVTLSGSQTMSLGPKKIMGNLSISNTAILTLTGTVYVTGNITIINSGIIKLDSSYGSLGGVILSDGLISPGNSSELQGSGQVGSYLLVLSTNPLDSAITVGNSALGSVFYANNGGITVSNNFSAREVTAYKLIMSNSATITYESGLANAFFSSGPAGGWKVTSWQEK